MHADVNIKMPPRRVLSIDLGSRNMAFALVDAPHTLVAWGMIDLLINQARQATDNLIDLLQGEEYKWIRQGTFDIVVETQPGSGVCKTLSHVLQGYFRALNPARKFHFMTPNNKLKFDLEIYDRVRPTSHAERKIVSMQVVERYVAAGAAAASGGGGASTAASGGGAAGASAASGVYAYYASRNHKQQTDLADAYIQACREIQLGPDAPDESGALSESFPQSARAKKRGKPQYRPSHYPEHTDFVPGEVRYDFTSEDVDFL